MKNLLRLSVLIIIALLLIGFNNNSVAAESTETEPDTVKIPETNLPKIDFHAHLPYDQRYFDTNGVAAYKMASALSKEIGVTIGVAEEFGLSDDISINDNMLLARIALAKEMSLYIGIQVSRRDWYELFSQEILDQIDYILGDAMIFQNKEGRTVLIWVPGMPLGEPEEFMELYMAHHLRVLSEPITIWANPTYLPDSLMSRYDELWTDARMKSLIDAAVRNNVAIEINSHYQIPNARFIKMAKVAGARFTFGTNQHGTGIGDITWSINMAEECGLTREDFFIPEREL